MKTEPAFPINSPGFPNGMSKRFYAACAAMQGIMAGHYSSLNGNIDTPVSKIVVDYAYELADELLKQENL